MTQRQPPATKARPGFPAKLVTGSSVPAPVNQQACAISTRQASVTPIGVGLDSGVVRRKMVAKIALEGVNHPRVLAAMTAIHRHRFVDSALVNQAYEDTSLPIGLGQTISKPSVVARMLALLCDGVAGRAGRVLEVGTGCGYQAALLGQLFDEVYSMERLRGLHEKARDNLRHLRLANVHLLFGDGMQGYAKGAPYAGIIAAAGGEAIPACWLDQLALGGRLVAPVSSGANCDGEQALMVVDKTAQGIQQTMMEAVRFVPLKSGVV